MAVFSSVNNNIIKLIAAPLLLVLLSLMASIGVGYLYLASSSKQDHQLKSEAAEQTISNINAEMGTVAGILGSLSSVQQLLADDYPDQLDVLAENAINQSDLISSIGRFGRVENDNRQKFESSMSESGIYNFSISAISADGKRLPVSEKKLYYPIVWQLPFTPQNAKFVGIDLSEYVDIPSLITLSDAKTKYAIIGTSEGWPTAPNTLMLQPTYYGRYTPVTADQRIAQSSGGIILGLDLTNIDTTDTFLSYGFSLELSILEYGAQPHSNTIRTVYRIDSPEKQKRYLSLIFHGVTISSFLRAGNNSILVNVRSTGGISASAFSKAVLLSTITFFGILMLCFLFSRQRKLDAQHRSDRDTALITLRAISDAVITSDENGTITYANPSSENLLKLSSRQLIGRPINQVLNIEYDSKISLDDKGEKFSFESALNHKDKNKFPELRLIDNENSAISIDSTFSSLGQDQLEQEKGHVLVMRDVSAERKLARELEFQATHDSLTKIPNRLYFETELKELIASSIDLQHQHAICYIDLDQFKTINDTCGHSAGDELLIKVTENLKSETRNKDLLARLGGDEFGLLIKNCNAKDAEALARRVFDLFQNMYFEFEGDLFAVRASIGFVHMDGQFNCIQDVMAAADLACYSAKDSGRNELHIYNHDNEETSDRMNEMMWLPKLQMALRCDNFKLFVQPIIGISEHHISPTISHYEILLRLITEDGKLITPAQLIVAAERYNLMRDIDRWVIGTAIDTIAKLQIHMKDSLPKFSINVSGQSTVDPELLKFIEEKITDSGVSPASLIFEITETSAITNMQSANNFVSFLHNIGCALALDDFGSGLSSFGYLKSFPVDYLKIDGQFIKNIHNNDVDREMVKCMQAVADLLSIDTIAEFVENKEIVSVIQELNIGYAQGYYYAKPHSIDDLFSADHLIKAA